MPLTEPVSGTTWPASVKPLGQSGARQKPSAMAAVQSRTLESGSAMRSPETTRQGTSAAGITCLGVKRIATGIEISRPTVNANPEGGGEQGGAPGVGHLQLHGVRGDPAAERDLASHVGEQVHRRDDDGRGVDPGCADPGPGRLGDVLPGVGAPGHADDPQAGHGCEAGHRPVRTTVAHTRGEGGAEVLRVGSGHRPDEPRHQERGQERAHAEGEMQAVHEGAGLLAVRPQEQRVGAGVDHALHRAADEHDGQEDPQSAHERQHGQAAGRDQLRAAEQGVAPYARDRRAALPGASRACSPPSRRRTASPSPRRSIPSGRRGA